METFSDKVEIARKKREEYNKHHDEAMQILEEQHRKLKEFVKDNNVDFESRIRLTITIGGHDYFKVFDA